MQGTCYCIGPLKDVIKELKFTHFRNLKLLKLFVISISLPCTLYKLIILLLISRCSIKLTLCRLLHHSWFHLCISCNIWIILIKLLIGLWIVWPTTTTTIVKPSSHTHSWRYTYRIDVIIYWRSVSILFILLRAGVVWSFSLFIVI